jgi:hypothetical protein
MLLTPPTRPILCRRSAATRSRALSSRQRTALGQRNAAVASRDCPNLPGAPRSFGTGPHQSPAGPVRGRLKADPAAHPRERLSPRSREVRASSCGTACRSASSPSAPLHRPARVATAARRHDELACHSATPKQDRKQRQDDGTQLHPWHRPSPPLPSTLSDVTASRLAVVGEGVPDGASLSAPMHVVPERGPSEPVEQRSTRQHNDRIGEPALRVQRGRAGRVFRSTRRASSRPPKGEGRPSSDRRRPRRLRRSGRMTCPGECCRRSLRLSPQLPARLPASPCAGATYT